MSTAEAQQANASTVSQLNTIAQEQQEVVAVGPEITFDSLIQEWAHSHVMTTKLLRASEDYKRMRRIRGDGSCFPRCYAFGLASHLVQSVDGKQAATNLLQHLQQYQKPMVTRYGEYMDDFCESAFDVFRSIAAGKETLATLESTFNSNVGDYIISFYRFLTSHYVREHEEIQIFIESGDVDTFCSTEIEAVGKEFDQIHIMALTSAVGVAVTIVYADLSPGEKCTTYTIPSDSASGSWVRVLYRPGHYDLLS
eukprot:PhF_6_TR17305/c0_g1_i1/m.26528/K09602/OTUB1; ubiquitin thioesterase protein OTUB1